MNQEISTTSEMLAQLKASPISLSPVTLTMRAISARLGDKQYGAIVDAAWGDDEAAFAIECKRLGTCLLYTSPSPRDQRGSRMPSSA